MAKNRKKPERDKLAVEVVDLASKFIERRLWTRVESDAPILVRVEGAPAPLLVNVLGSGGGVLGIGVLFGDDAVLRFEALMASGGRERGARCGLLLLTFETMSDVDPRFLRTLVASGKPHGRGSSVPVFVAVDEDGTDRSMSRPELRQIGEILRTLFEADRRGVLLPRPWDWRRRMLELELVGTGARAEVRDRVVTCPASRSLPAPASDIDLGTSWYAEVAALPRSGANWTCAAMPAPRLESDDTAREIILILDESKGVLLPPAIVPADDARALAEAISGAFQGGGRREEAPGVPARIAFIEQRFVGYLAEAFARADIPVVHVEEETETVRLLDEALGSLGRHLGAGPRGDSDADDDLETWRQASISVGSTLVESAPDPDPRSLAKYFGGVEAAQEAVENEDDVTPRAAFLEWFTVDYRPRPGARTTAERILSRKTLRAREEMLLESRIHARVILARVVDLDPGASVTVENVADGTKTVVHDRGISMSATVGLGLVLRLFAGGPWTFTQIAGPVVGPLALDRLRADIEELGLTFENGEIKGDRSLLGQLFARNAARPPMVLQNTDGEALELISATFACAEGLDVGAALARLPNVVAEGNDVWNWVEPKKGSSDSDGGTLMGRLQLIGNQLLVAVNSRERVEKAKRLLRGTAGIEFVGARALAHRGNGGSAQEIELDDELAAKLEKVLHEKIMGWLDEPIPALGGKTPREAVLIPALRPQVESMIRTYPDSGGPGRIIRAPREEMLRELGLTGEG